MRSLLAIVLVVAYCLPTVAEIGVSVKHAKAVVTVEAIETTQVTTKDGDKIGSPSVKKLNPSVRDGRSVAVLVIKTDRPVSELLLRVRSKTCKPYKVSPSIYAISEPGTHEVSIDAIGQNPLSWDSDTVVVTVSDSDPPGPKPNPDAPIDLPGLRVLFIYESADISRMSIEQQSILRSRRMARFLDENCVADGWRVLDKDTKYTNPDHHWAKALGRDRDTIPWLVISNGTTGFEGPLPASVDETISLIEKYRLDQ